MKIEPDQIRLAILLGIIAGIVCAIVKLGWEIPFPPRTPFATPRTLHNRFSSNLDSPTILLT